jgi:hypothetical protein
MRFSRHFCLEMLMNIAHFPLGVLMKSVQAELVQAHLQSIDSAHYFVTAFRQAQRERA